MIVSFEFIENLDRWDMLISTWSNGELVLKGWYKILSHVPLDLNHLISNGNILVFEKKMWHDWKCKLESYGVAHIFLESMV